MAGCYATCNVGADGARHQNWDRESLLLQVFARVFLSACLPVPESQQFVRPTGLVPGMAFDPTFGSFGDFLSIAVLVKDIAIALDDGKKYQALVQALETLSNTCAHLGVPASDETPVRAEAT